MSPYPEKPKQPDTQEHRGDEPQTLAAVPPYSPPLPEPSPQVTGGAPPLTYRGDGTYARIEGTKERTYDFNNPIPPAVGGGGPERWDTPRRLVSQYNLERPTRSPAHPYVATEIMAEHPEAVAKLRELLLERRGKVSDRELAESDFWKDFDTMGQAFVAEFLGNIMGVLTGHERRDQEENPITLTQTQQDWVRNHPLTRWMEWI